MSEATAPILKLFPKKNHLQSASLPIRWCVTKTGLENLRENGAVNPHLLIITTRPKDQENGEVTSWEEVTTSRQLVPLDRGAAWLEFHRLGHQRIVAMIVWDKNGRKKTLQNECLTLSSWISSPGGYRTGFLDYSGDVDVEMNGHSASHLGEAYLEIDVSSEFFAELPFDWDWTNWVFENSPKNQCLFRRRRFFSWTIQPPLFLLYVIISVFLRLVLLLVMVLGGFWDFVADKFTAAFRPIECTWLEFFGDDVGRNTYFVGSNGEYRHWCHWPAVAFDRVLHWMLDEINEVDEKRHKAALARDRAAMADRLKNVSCQMVGKDPDFDFRSLPKRDVYTLYCSVKAVVCKPFSR